MTNIPIHKCYITYYIYTLGVPPSDFQSFLKGAQLSAQAAAAFILPREKLWRRVTSVPPSRGFRWRNICKAAKGHFSFLAQLQFAVGKEWPKLPGDCLPCSILHHKGKNMVDWTSSEINFNSGVQPARRCHSVKLRKNKNRKAMMFYPPAAMKLPSAHLTRVRAGSRG